jgi:hypothetical protein
MAWKAASMVSGDINRDGDYEGDIHVKSRCQCTIIQEAGNEEEGRFIDEANAGDGMEGGIFENGHQQDGDF